MGIGLGWAVSVSAQSNEVVHFEVDAQPLNAALDAWAAQSGLQFVAPGGLLTAQESPGVVGTLSAEQGLRHVLAQSMIDFEFVNTHTVSLRDGPAANPSASAATLRSVSAILLAGAVAPTSVEGEPTGRIELDEIVVTGTRLRDPREGATRVTVMDRERLDQLGVATLGDVVRYLAEQPYAFAAATGTTGGEFVEIRGLGLGSTLVLLNGRRVTPSAADIAFNVVDLNIIPLAAVERVEMLAESASSVYGADAMGGVMNIVLKKDLSRPVVELRYGAAAGGADERRASVSAGLAGERGQLSLVLDAFEQEMLVGSERALFGDQDFRRFGGPDRRTLNAHPGNITARGAGNLPGLNSPFAAVPVGSTGVGLTPADLAATAGQRRFASPNQYRPVVPAAERLSAAAFGELRFAENVTASLEALYAERQSDFQLDPASLSGVAVPATNPFNPFRVAVTANYSFVELGPRHVITDSELLRGAGAVRGLLGSWEWELSGVRSTEEGSEVTRNGVDVARRNAALASTNPDTALNVFKDGPAGSPALLQSLIAYPVPNTYESNGTLASGFLRGSLFSLPGGAVEAVVGGEWRDEDILFRESFAVVADRQVSSAFSELRVPLIGERMGVSAVHALTLTAAARYDEYSDFGDTVNPQVGLTWWLDPSVLLRASHGRGFRAPSLFELHSPRTNVQLNLVDPRRGNEVVAGIGIAGGNPALRPIESDFMTAGVVWHPSAELRLSLDYFRIHLDERIASFNEVLVLANEADYPERVVRTPATPADIAAGLPGRLLSVDVSRINYGTLDTRGIDLEFSYEWQTAVGTLVPRLTATWLDQYDTVDLPQTPVYDRLDRANPNGTITQWRAVGSLGWTQGMFSAAITARFVPGYEDYDSLSETLTGRYLHSTTLIDAQAALDVGSHSDSPWLRGTKLTLGVTNLFDEEPQFSVVGVSSGADRSQADLRQRFAYVQLAKQF